ncbi:hydrogenase small subunit [Calderihabitans maritimus]|uniref:Hydrogenase n=1 Tax=Calderihabitans maritimus TaxID=1246530 RepID=A0A1Z5HNX3_9FIRM|nr:hydrogenase small subunit [Calderihabitans maritimus]GAW91214.1 hydrogenase [Calderihabitans maritimus]
MLTRRKFLKLCMQSGLAFSLAQFLLNDLAEALSAGKIQKLPVVWIEAGTCTGNSISLDNSIDPGLKKILLDIVDLRYHWLFLTAQGKQAVDALEEAVQKYRGEFILIVEGAVVTRDHGKYNYVLPGKENDFRTGMEVIRWVGQEAKYVMPVGTCATHGGPAAAYPNPSGSIGVGEFLQRPVINVPGCPAHPDWIVGTLVHLLYYGLPELDAVGRPVMFYGKTIHDLCTRRQYFENGIFAEQPGQAGCMYRLGCKGPVTYADCPKRQWNNHVNWPVGANSPCIGCASPDFPDGMSPFFQHLPDIRLPGVVTSPSRIAKALGGLTAVGITTHLTASIISGRIGKNMTDGTKEKTSLPARMPEDQIMEKLNRILDSQEAFRKELQPQKTPQALQDDENQASDKK